MQQILQKRYSHNCTAFITIYAIVGVLNGLMCDALVTYLMSVSPAAARGIASYMGAATFAASFLAILALRYGYKRLMLLAAVCMTASLAAISFLRNSWLISMALLLLMTGTTLFDVMLAPFLAAYSDNVKRTSIFTRASFFGVVGLILGTSLGGPLIVWIFSMKLNISYYSAMVLTKNTGALSLEQQLCYIGSNRAVIMVFAVISILVLIPVILVKEAPADHKNEAAAKPSGSSGIWGLLNKYVLVFLAYAVIARFGAVLIAPQVSVYLTKIGINRASISLLSTLQYIAILVFMAFSPRLVARLGQVRAIVALCIASIPFMLILANGNSYGNGAEFIIGTALFFRAGLSNAATPAVNSLTMDLVPKSYRPLYASLVFIMQSIAQIFAGIFAGYFLYRTANGYAYAYYYAAVLYVAAHMLLLIFFRKKYNLLPEAKAGSIAENSQSAV